MGKLKSRKFWIAIIVIAYGAIMGVRALGVGDQITTIFCVAAAAVAGIAYIVAEMLLDEDRITDETTETEDEEGEE